MDRTATLDVLKDFGGPALFEYENTVDIEKGSIRCLKYITNLVKKEK